MDRITIEDVIAHSGVDPRILHFAAFNGFRPAHSDLTLDEQAARIRRAHPEMDREDVLVMLGDDLKDEVNDFFNEAFPVVRSNAC